MNRRLYKNVIWSIVLHGDAVAMNVIQKGRHISIAGGVLFEDFLIQKNQGIYHNSLIVFILIDADSESKNSAFLILMTSGSMMFSYDSVSSASGKSILF